MFSAVECLFLPNNAAEQLLLMQNMISHKIKGRSSWEAQSEPILSGYLALRGELGECLKPFFYQ
jgi:hypothetical protein